MKNLIKYDLFLEHFIPGNTHPDLVEIVNTVRDMLLELTFKDITPHIRGIKSGKYYITIRLSKPNNSLSSFNARRKREADSGSFSLKDFKESVDLVTEFLNDNGFEMKGGIKFIETYPETQYDLFFSKKI